MPAVSRIEWIAYVVLALTLVGATYAYRLPVDEVPFRLGFLAVSDWRDPEYLFFGPAVAAAVMLALKLVSSWIFSLRPPRSASGEDLVTGRRLLDITQLWVALIALTIWWRQVAAARGLGGDGWWVDRVVVLGMPLGVAIWCVRRARRA